MKFDEEKTMFQLLDYFFVEEMAEVLTDGAKKYLPNNWKTEDKKKYQGALMRHFSAYMQGEIIDSESKLPHMAHVAINAMFLDWFDRNGQTQ